MPHLSATPRRLIGQLRNALFDVSSEGILIYKDPLVGLLQNRKKEIAVRLNPGKTHLELEVRGKIRRVFPLQNGMAKACLDAVAAYFAAFEQLCRCKENEAAWAA